MSASAQAPPVTVAIVSWNTRELLDACLRSLAADVESGQVDAWVVDNASGDGSAELVRTRFPWAHLVALEENVGFGAAVNRVAAQTSSRWLAIANADVSLAPGALQALLSAAGEDATAGAIAPRLELPDGRTQHSVYAFPTLTFTLLFNLGVYRLSRRIGDRMCLEGWWDPSRARAVDWAIGAFVLLRREAWEAAGGFDERHWMYAEDLDLGWRLARGGWHTRYEPSALVRHDAGAATRQAWPEDRTARWLASTYAWMLRRRGTAVTRLAATINVLGALVRAAALTPLAALSPARWAAPRTAARRWAALHRQVGLGPRADLERHR